MAWRCRLARTTSRQHTASLIDPYVPANLDVGRPSGETEFERQSRYCGKHDELPRRGLISTGNIDAEWVELERSSLRSGWMEDGAPAGVVVC